MPAPLKVGLAGLGTVGQSVVRLLRDDAAGLAARAGRRLVLTRVASRTPRPNVDIGDAPFATDARTLIDAQDVDVIVETIASADAEAALAAAKGLLRGAIDAGKGFVTANKALVAREGNVLLAAARQAGTPVGFEAAVAGGVPIINALSQGLAANRIEWLAGIVNGTCNHILTAMARDGQGFDAALAEAQRLGYAEADPTFDVEGIDAAHKIAILAHLAFGAPLDLDGVHVEGIRAIDAEDLTYARELGYRVKHLGLARRGEQPRVHPCLLAEDSLIAKVDGVLNAVQVHGHAVGSTLYVGPGAGGMATASAIVANLIEIAQGGPSARPAPAEEAATARFATLASRHYLKIPAADEPGVFAHVAEVLSRHDVSIESAIQRGAAVRDAATAPWVPIVILTNAAPEATMREVVTAIEGLDGVTGCIRRIRVADIDGRR